ncbi:MAG: sulfurtransferase [Magnetococcales bacterium]|nr:sulfurtransferase [Magnetococcales bacterium]
MSIAEALPKTSNSLDDSNPNSFIVSQDWLEANLQNPNLRIIQVSGEKYFYDFHIPGAVLLPYNTIVQKSNGALGARATEEKLIEIFSQLGIGPQTQVLAYDLAGGADSGRLIWTLATMGHTGGGMILDGGLGRWYEEKRPMEQKITEINPVKFISRPDNSWDVSAEEVDELSQSDWDGVIIDVRTSKEYTGKTISSPRGHINGAYHFEWTQTLRSKSDSRLLDIDQIREMLKKVGVENSEQEIIVYCESGHRASQSWVLLRHLGFKKVRLFAGSISQWRSMGLPVVPGVNPS